MLRRRFLMTVIGGALAAAIAAPAIAQEVVVTGPPPELRTHLDAFMKAFNSANDDDWEAMAKTVFTPEFLKKQTPAERKKAVAAMRAQFGKIHIQQVDRRGGPDAPLQVTVAGTVASGSIWIDLDDSSRFDSLKAEVKKLNERRRH